MTPGLRPFKSTVILKAQESHNQKYSAQRWRTPFSPLRQSRRSSRKRDSGMSFRQRLETVTHVIDLLSFLRDRSRYRLHGPPESLRRETFGGAHLVQEI
jgi:hypothetical protein